MPQPSWSPSTTQQLRKLVAAPYLPPNDWTPRSEAYFVFPLAQGTPGKQCGLAATGVYQPSLRSPWLAANAIVLKVSNGPAEGLNSRIKMIKVRSRGFRNKERFANAIYFHLGGLDLYPDGITR
ncbi:transposase [Thiolapillus sp.]|uniref:transposase n=1 Tax=Thiolapillus sp. TaxID=2017437 RepID=UPI003AF7E96F